MNYTSLVEDMAYSNVYVGAADMVDLSSGAQGLAKECWVIDAETWPCCCIS